MNILLVEDDYLEEELIRKTIEEECRRHGQSCHVEVITSEEMFHKQIEAIVRGVRRPDLAIMDMIVPYTDSTTPELVPPARPDLVIMDAMMPWTGFPEEGDDEGPSMPDEVRRDGPYRAGLRCAEHLARIASDIPIQFYSVLQRTDLDSPIFDRKNVGYIPKDDDSAPLADCISRHLARLQRSKRRPGS